VALITPGKITAEWMIFVSCFQWLVFNEFRHNIAYFTGIEAAAFTFLKFFLEFLREDRRAHLDTEFMKQVFRILANHYVSPAFCLFNHFDSFSVRPMLDRERNRLGCADLGKEHFYRLGRGYPKLGKNGKRGFFSSSPKRIW
jgi:hypothetical protein